MNSIKKFLPLIIIFSLIAALTLFTAHTTNALNIHYVMRYFMGFFFVVFGVFKIMNLHNFAQAYAEYDLIAKRSKTYGYVYPFIELTLGITYLFNLYPFATNLITFAVMSVSALGVAVELAKKRSITCACLGTVFKIPMTYVTLLEDVLMAGMALFMLFL